MSQPAENSTANWWPVLLTLAIVLAIVFALFQPWNIDNLTSHPNPVKSYEEAFERIQNSRSGQTNLNPVCQTQFLTHGQQTERVIVFAHGYTSCPQQFAELGKRFFDLGYNVLIVPVPHHGLTDRMTDEQSRITSEEYITYTDQVVDIAVGLGKRVIVAGISQGGVLTAWAAQNRSEIELAVIISPGFSFKEVPLPLTVPIANIFRILPVSYDWWDPALKEKLGPSYGYPRYTKRTLGEIMRLGFSVRAAAQRSAPAARSLLMVTNANDQSVSNETAAQMVQIWRTGGANIATYEFEASLGLGHDMIDPNDKDANIEVVYPRLIELINR